MARNRKSTESNATSTKENSNMSEGMFTPIEDTDLLADILAGARGRGDYKTVLGAFIESGHRLVEVPLTGGLFEGKKAQTVKTGFENAKNAKEPVEGSDKVKVVKKGEQVYLVNQAIAA